VTLLRGPFEDGSMFRAEGEGELFKQALPVDPSLGESGSRITPGKPESVKASSDRRLSLWPESNRGRFLFCCELDASRESLRVLEDSVIEL
jgi:hypothetical protein